MSATTSLPGTREQATRFAATYLRYRLPLERWLAGRVTAPATVIEEACAETWLIYLRRPPAHDALFAWLRVVARHEALRLLDKQRREPSTVDDHDRPEFVPNARDDLDVALQARDALHALAGLRNQQRRYLARKVAGYSYREIQALENATYTQVNRHLTRARARLRAAA